VARGPVTQWKAQNDHHLKKKKKNQGYQSNRLPNYIQAYKTNMTKLRIYTPQTTCQCARENQIENVISHAANESNTILNSFNKVII
jgi:hypothetical protein